MSGRSHCVLAGAGEELQGIASDERFCRLLHLVEADRLPPAAFSARLDKGGVMQTLRQLARHWLRPAPAREPLAA